MNPAHVQNLFVDFDNTPADRNLFVERRGAWDYQELPAEPEGPSKPANFDLPLAQNLFPRQDAKLLNSFTFSMSSCFVSSPTSERKGQTV